MLLNRISICEMCEENLVIVNFFRWLTASSLWPQSISTVNNFLYMRAYPLSILCPNSRSIWFWNSVITGEIESYHLPTYPGLLFTRLRWSENAVDAYEGLPKYRKVVVTKPMYTKFRQALSLISLSVSRTRDAYTEHGPMLSLVTSFCFVWRTPEISGGPDIPTFSCITPIFTPKSSCKRVMVRYTPMRPSQLKFAPSAKATSCRALLTWKLLLLTAVDKYTGRS